MIVHLEPETLVSGLAAISPWHLHLSLGNLGLNETVLAQQTNVDILADFQRAWSNFVKTGQIWAMFVGILVGWWLKSTLRP